MLKFKQNVFLWFFQSYKKTKCIKLKGRDLDATFKIQQIKEKVGKNLFFL